MLSTLLPNSFNGGEAKYSFKIECMLIFFWQGADISLERAEDKREDVKQIIDVCDTCFKLEADSEIEGVLNGIVSMIPNLSDTDKEQFVLNFCEKLSKAPSQNHGVVALKVGNVEKVLRNTVIQISNCSSNPLQEI